MKIAPLIHSRTGEQDYNSKFAVRPKNFSSAEISWARSKILPATRNIERLNGLHRLVAAKDGICIAGVVCTMKYFVNNCLNAAEDAKPFVDVQGRLYGVFLGYAFKTSGNEIPIVTDADLWQWFEKYLVPEWNKKSARTVEVDYFAWDKVSFARSDKTPSTDKYFDVQLYDVAEFDDEKLFREYLSRALTSRNEIAFCSNVDRVQPVEEKIYTAVTTSAKNITALKKNVQEQRPPIVQPEKKTTSQKQADAHMQPTTTNHKPPQSTSTEEKFPWTILLICLIILAAIVFFMTRQSADDSEQHSTSTKEISLLHRETGHP